MREQSTLTSAAVVLVLISPVLLAVWIVATSAVVNGKIVDKRESIEMPLEDAWRHVFAVTYKYQPADSASPITASHPVDVSLYDRLAVGATVKVRYSTLPLFLPIVGLGSALVDSSWLSRIPTRSEGRQELVEVGAICAIGLLGFAAYRMRSRTLGLLAGITGAVFASSVLLIGFLIFPFLFVAWLRNPGKGFGWALVATVTLSLIALYYRVPAPSAMPAGPYGHATAIARKVRTVRQIWASSSDSDSDGGQNIRHSFQMVDLEFLPPGATQPVHALDRVDLESVPGLHEGVSLSIVYPISDPRAGQLAAGTRRYGDEAFVYLLEATIGLGAAVGAVLFAMFWIADKLSRSPLFRVIASEEGRNALAARLQSEDGLPEQVRKLARLGRARERPSRRDD